MSKMTSLRIAPRPLQVALLGSALAALAAFASPASSHGGGDPGEGAGYPPALLSGFEFIGPSGPEGDWHIQDEPCTNADNPNGNSPHIGHITLIEDLNALGVGDPNRWVAPGTVDLWHFDTYETPALIEGTPDGDIGIMTGTDGYFRATMQSTLADGPSWDLKFYDYHPWASYCVYGQPTSETEKWLFVGTAFPIGLPPPNDLTPMDLKYFYSPLFGQVYSGQAPEIKRLLIIGSLEKYPAIDASFTFTPPSPVTYTDTVTFSDQSSRYGYPQRDDIRTNDPDPLDLWEWYVDTDPTGATSFTVGVTAPTLSAASSVVPPPMSSISPGLYTVCLRVWAHDNFAPYMGGGFMHNPSLIDSKDTECKTLEVVNAPPVVSYEWIQVPGDHGRHFTFAGNALDPDANCIQAWEWDVNGEAFPTAGAIGNTMGVDHLFPTDGTKTVKVRVQDCAGAWSAWFVNAVAALNHAPVITAIPAMVHKVGETVSYSFLFADPDGDPVEVTNSGLPDAAVEAVAPPTGTLSWPDAGPVSVLAITHTVSDGELQDSEVASITLWEPGLGSDSDGNGVADISEPCPDGSGAILADGCPGPAEEQAPAGGESNGESAAPANGAGAATSLPHIDTDRDGVVDVSDNCPAVRNADQADLDTDLAGDACDGDLDGDGVPQAGLDPTFIDNCPSSANADQEDLDANGLGDACDDVWGSSLTAGLGGGAGCATCGDGSLAGAARSDAGAASRGGDGGVMESVGGWGLVVGLAALVGVALLVTAWALNRR